MAEEAIYFGNIEWHELKLKSRRKLQRRNHFLSSAVDNIPRPSLSFPADEMMMWRDLDVVGRCRQRNLRKLKFRSHNCQVFSIKGNYNKTERREERRKKTKEKPQLTTWNEQKKTHFLVFCVVLTSKKRNFSRSRRSTGGRGSAADLNYSSWSCRWRESFE